MKIIHVITFRLLLIFPEVSGNIKFPEIYNLTYKHKPKREMHDFLRVSLSMLLSLLRSRFCLVLTVYMWIIALSSQDVDPLVYAAADYFPLEFDTLITVTTFHYY